MEIVYEHSHSIKKNANIGSIVDSNVLQTVYTTDNALMHGQLISEIYTQFPLQVMF